jgi:hypothetical protein
MEEFEMRKKTTIVVCLLLVACMLMVSAVVVAPKPGDKPGKPPKDPPPPPPTGTIYFIHNGGSGNVWWTMKADGTEKTELPVGSCDDNSHTKWGKLSHLKHGDHYWIVRFCGVAGTYPDGEGRRELFAVRDDNAVTVQLTNDPNIQPNWYRRNLAWTFDDLKIAFGAKRWVNDPDPTIAEFGIYEANVAYDGNGDISGLSDPVLIWDTGSVSWGGRYYPDMQHLDWSPDGNHIVFMRMSMGLTLHMVDLVASTEIYLTVGEGPQWSPDGSKIAFSGNDDLRTINPDGTGEQIVVEDKDNGKWDERLNLPEWSPDSSHLTYWLHKLSQRGMGSDSDIYRVGADGSDKTCLTSDLDGVWHVKGWR